MILKGKALYKMEVSPIRRPTFGSVFGSTELTFQFKDGHVEVIQLHDGSQSTKEYESIQAFADAVMSGDMFLLDQSMKKDYNRLFCEVLVGLEEKGIDSTEIEDIYYMDM